MSRPTYRAYNKGPHPTSLELEIRAERRRQDAKWGEQNHPDGTGGPTDAENRDLLRERCEARFKAGHGTWRDILDEEIAEAYAETDPAKLRPELLQAAAVLVAWAEAIDRRMPVGTATNGEDQPHA